MYIFPIAFDRYSQDVVNFFRTVISTRVLLKCFLNIGYFLYFNNTQVVF